MWNVFGRILKSDLYYLVGRAMKMNDLLARAVAVDAWFVDHSIAFAHSATLE